MLIDADGLVVGRLAAVVATRLRGKHKPSYTPHMDCGDNVIVINAEKVVLTGNKAKDKVYHWHTGYIGGIKERTPEQYPRRQDAGARRRKGRRAHAAARTLGQAPASNLRVYAGPEHPHEAQQPETLDVGAMNPKNHNYRKAKAG